MSKKVKKHNKSHAKCQSSKCPAKSSRVHRFMKRMILTSFAILVAYTLGTMAYEKFLPVLFPVSEASDNVNPVVLATIKGTEDSYKAMRIAEADQWREVPAVLKRIAQAESHNSHYCTVTLVKEGLCSKSEEGQVLVNSTRDVGRYAINMYWQGKFCTELGFNIFDEKQNEQCAVALYHEYGTKPWEPSAKYWAK
jgi:hypothetical protein